MFHATTIVCVRKKGKVALGSDGQVSFGSTVMKHKANKVRTMRKGSVITGFAGSTADAFTLFERFEGKLDEYKGNLTRASVELAKEWRTDKILRRLEAMMIVADKKNTYTISGNGDVLEPDDDIAAIGSGGPYALSAGRALIEYSDLSAKKIVQESLKIAADICIYTNNNFTIEEIK